MISLDLLVPGGFPWLQSSTPSVCEAKVSLINLLVLRAEMTRVTSSGLFSQTVQSSFRATAMNLQPVMESICLKELLKSYRWKRERYVWNYLFEQRENEMIT